MRNTKVDRTSPFNLRRLHLRVDYTYGSEPAEVYEISAVVDPRFLSEPWEEVVMFASAEDACLGKAQPEEVTIVFADRTMGLVVYYDALVDEFVTCYVEEE